MLYNYDNTGRDRWLFNVSKLYKKALPFNLNSSKEILQYAVGGLLYMPANTLSIKNKLFSSQYSMVKSLVLDLEDSIGDEMIDTGIKNIYDILNDIDNKINNKSVQLNDIPLIFIRIREPKQIDNIIKTMGVLIKYIVGFCIPKFSPDNCDEYIERFCENFYQVKKDYNKHLYVMPIIEDKKAIYIQNRIDTLMLLSDRLKLISDKILNIRVGGTDFCSLFGVRRNKNENIYQIGVIRSALEDIINVFSRDYIVSAPVWEYFEDGKNVNQIDWKDGLENEIKKDMLNGFFGKTIIHPSQLPIIQKSLIVKYDDYIDAIDILGMNKNTVGVKKSSVTGRMNEVKTHTNWAKKIIGIADVYGVYEPDK